MVKPLPEGTRTPRHLAIIPDGNRRWARLHHLPTISGHRKGFKVLLELARAARNWGIHTVTIWLFSTENWQRSKEEISYLMKTGEEMLKKYLPEAQKDGVKIVHLGRKERIPESLVRTFAKVEKETKNNKKYLLNIALDYGGRDEIIRAIRKMENCQAKPGLALPEKSRIKNLTEESFAQFLDTAGQPYPYPDLLIRPSGEIRTSGLLLWQMAYTEFVFIKKHLPDCTLDDLRKAILEYSRRERRFGR